MSMLKKLSWVTLLMTYFQVILGKCPDASEILPCYGCEDGFITCSGVEKIDLNKIFDKLNKALEPKEKNFIILELNNTCNADSKAWTFGDISFRKIVINQTCFTHIYPDAFAASFAVTKELIISSNYLLNQDNILDLINKFTNLVSLKVHDDYIKVPKNAFGNHPKIRDLYIQSDGESIGSHAFRGLSGLTSLNLQYSSLTHISANAFSIDQPSGERLYIHFNNNDLNEHSFDTGALVGINRPTVLGFTSDNCQFRYLPQHIFLPFIKENDKNFVEFYNKYEIFDCQDCRSYWITQNNLFANFRNLKCCDGKPLNDPANFALC